MYLTLWYQELFESTIPGHMEQMRAGVYCYRPWTNGRADAYMVFENVFSIGHWWNVKLELHVDGDQGTKAHDQWVQPSDSISLHTV